MANNKNDQGETGPPSNLEGFITTQINNQEKSLKPEDNVDTAKRDSFIARAIAESRRMNQEVSKAEEKRSRLRAEFGEKMMAEWRDEHSAMVLSPQQTDLVNQTYQNGTESSGNS